MLSFSQFIREQSTQNVQLLRPGQTGAVKPANPVDKRYDELKQKSTDKWKTPEEFKKPSTFPGDVNKQEIEKYNGDW